MKKLNLKAFLAVLFAALAAGVKFTLAQVETPPSQLVPSTNINSIRDFYNIVCVVTQWVLVFGFIIGALFVIYGGYKYVTSAGDDSAASDARKIIQNALIGVVLLLLATAFIRIIANFFGAGGFSINIVTCG
jgi:hypothetical protein